MFNKHLFKSQNCRWATPSGVFKDLHKEFSFTLDVCADANNAKCRRYYDIEDDGLVKPWAPYVCWMNPPYGRGISQWMKKAVDEASKGATVVALIPARTDTKWWHQYAMLGEIRFLNRRLSFDGADNKAPFPKDAG